MFFSEFCGIIDNNIRLLWSYMKIKNIHFKEWIQMMSITIKSRILAFVLAIAMVLSLVPVMAAADSGKKYVGYAKITYPENDGDYDYNITTTYFDATGKATNGQVAVKIAHEKWDGEIETLLYYNIINVTDGKINFTVSLDEDKAEGKYFVEFIADNIDDTEDDAYFYFNKDIATAEKERDDEIKEANNFSDVALQQKLLTLNDLDVYNKYVVEEDGAFYEKVEAKVYDLNPTYESDSAFVKAVEEATVIALFDSVTSTDKDYFKEFIGNKDVLDVIAASEANKNFNAKKTAFDKITDESDRTNTINLIANELAKKNIYDKFDSIKAVADHLYTAFSAVLVEKEEGGVKDTIKNDNSYTPSGTVVVPSNPTIHVTSVFTDVDANYWWVINPLQELYSKGFVNGRTATTFAPGENITRAEFLKILLMELNMVDANATVAFTDVNANDWFYSYVASGFNKGIVKGRSETEFAPNALITREEICIMTMRAVRARNINLGTAVATGKFTDEAAIASYAVEDVHALKAAGIVSGRDTGAFDPKANATRAEAVKILYGVYERQ